MSKPRPTLLSIRSTLLCLSVALGTTLFNPLWGQDVKPKPLTEVERWRQSKDRALKILAEDQRLEKSLADSRVLLEGLRKQQETLKQSGVALVVSKTAAMSKQLKVQLENLKHEQQRLEASVQLGKSAAAQIKTHEGLLDARREHCAKTSEVLSQLTKDYASWPEKRVAERLKSLSFQSLKELSESLAHYASLSKSLAEERAEMVKHKQAWDEFRSQAQKALPTIEKQLAATQDGYQQALKRERVIDDLKRKSAQDLKALLAGKQLEWQSLQSKLKAFEDRKQDFMKTWDQLEAQWTGLKVPEASDFKSSSKLPKVQAADISLQLTTALISYHKTRLKILEKAEQWFKNWDKEALEWAQQLESMETTLLELDVLASSLQQVQEEGQALLPSMEQQLKSAQVRAALERLRTAREALKSAQEQWPKRRDRWRESGTVSERDLKKLEPQKPALEEELTQERHWGQFVEQVASQSHEALLQTFASRQAAFKDCEARIEQARGRWRQAQKLFESKRLRALDQDSAEVVAWKAENQGQRLQLLNSMRQALGLDTRPLPGPKSAPVGTKDGPQDKDHEARLQRESLELDNRQHFLKQRARFLTDALQAFEEAQKRLQELCEALQQSLELARQCYGCAEQILIRVGEKRLDAKHITDAVTAFSKRERLVSIAGLLEREKRSVVVLERQGQELREWQTHNAQRTDLLIQIWTCLKQEIKAVRERVDVLKSVDEEPKAYDDYRNNAFKDRADEWLSSDDQWSERLIAFARSETTKVLDKRLHDLYFLLVVHEYRSVLLSLAQDKSRKLLKITTDRGRLLQTLRQSLERLRQSRDLAYWRWQQDVAVQLDPNKLASLTDEYKTRTGADLVVLRKAQEEDLDKLALEGFDRRAELAVLEARLEELEQASSALGQSQLQGPYEKDIASYEARKQKIKDAQASLSGEGLERNPEEEKLLMRLRGVDQPLAEIPFLRAKLWQAHVRALQRAILSLIFIPLIAYLLIGLGRKAAQSFVALLQIGRGPNVTSKDREQRQKTMVTVSAAAWKTLVIVLSVIYLFKQIGADVTPILASAGIAGLAFVFGAQSLIKDFFSGFFILLENQYKIGDYVSLNGLSGTVEDLSLRLTLLRDPEGNLHFVSNGSLDTVTNYTHGWSGLNVDVSVAYDTDIDTVLELLRKLSHEYYEDPRWKPLFHEPPAVYGVQRFDDSGIVIRTVIRSRPGEQWGIGREFRRRIKYAFDKSAVEIPFPQMVIHPTAGKGLGKGAPPFSE